MRKQAFLGLFGKLRKVGPLVKSVFKSPRTYQAAVLGAIPASIFGNWWLFREPSPAEPPGSQGQPAVPDQTMMNQPGPMVAPFSNPPGGGMYGPYYEPSPFAPNEFHRGIQEMTMPLPGSSIMLR